MELMQAIKGRRSVRKYKKDDLSAEQISLILEAAVWAPSWANTQCWRFVVVKDKAIKERLAHALTTHNPATQAVIEAPVVIVGCGAKGKAGFYKGQAVTDKGDWMLYDVALSFENLSLAAHSLGLGTVHIGAFNTEKVKEALELPEDMVPVIMTPLGYPEEVPSAPPRKPVPDVTYINKYGNKWQT